MPDWPYFIYDVNGILKQERDFLLSAGITIGCLKNMKETDRNQFIIEILSSEGTESSKIEGEVLNRADLQSSIRKHFGLNEQNFKKGEKESRMAKLLWDVYESFDAPLTNQMLYQWHAELEEVGTYRTHLEPMQIVSNRLVSPKIFFELPFPDCSR